MMETSGSTEQSPKEIADALSRHVYKRLRTLGYKEGDCGYCSAKNGEEIGDKVLVKKLPNRIFACYPCYQSMT